MLLQNNPKGLAEVEEKLNHQLHMQRFMIVGEGAVFLFMLLLGIIRTRNSFKKEALLNAYQRNFLLSVTHELKSPIASLQLQLETLRKHQLSPIQHDEILSDALEDTERLQTLVENILLAARIDNSSHELYFEEGNLSAELNTLLDRIVNHAARHHKLASFIDSDIHLRYDRVAFPSIVLNLIENAVKYSPAGSTITVHLKQNQTTAQLIISDQGPGIPDNEKKAIFQRFYRLGNEETRSAKGTGLGLYIVNYLVEQHGWTIHIRDNANGGSSFEIYFPKLKS
jgi:signal transduction histidine kinase